MDIGTGIAIAGVWMFAGIFSASKTTTSFGFFTSVIIACVMTYYLK